MRQLAISSAMVLVLALVHFTALTLLFRWAKARQPRWSTSALAPVPLLLAAFGGVLAVHVVEIWLFAGLYLLLGALPDFETALYFSAISYASIGYGDVILGENWRLVGAIEGTSGVILLGCSTAFLVALVTELALFETPRGGPRKERKSGRRR